MRMMTSTLALLIAIAAAFVPAAYVRADEPPVAHHSGFAYIALKPLAFPLAHAQSTVTITLEVPEDREAAVEILRQRLTDTFATQLQSLAGDGQVVDGADVDTEHMKIFLMTAAIRMVCAASAR